MSKPRIYLAGPYSSHDPEVQRLRGINHCKIAVELLRMGHICYSPIAETMNLAQYGGMKGADWDTWREKDCVEIDRSDEMWIATMIGWQNSKGVRGEVKHCIKTQKPILLYNFNQQLAFDLSVDALLRELGVTSVEELND